MNFAERLVVFARLHCLQILWNFKGMQHFGCLLSLRPVLRRLFSGADYVDAEKRHAQFFNTHPYLAPICLGVVVKLEEELKEGSFKKPEMIPILKNRMSGPLAAVGDAFFWETLIPVFASLGVFAVFLLGPGTREAGLVIAAVVGAYILIVELTRWQGLDWGYRHGIGVVEVLKRKDFQGTMRRIRNIAAILLGISAVTFVLISPSGVFEAREVILRAVALIILLLMTLQKTSPTLQLYLLALVAFGLGLVMP